VDYCSDGGSGGSGLSAELGEMMLLGEGGDLVPFISVLSLGGSDGERPGDGVWPRDEFPS
jgi:hypothetical protein